MQSSFDKSKIVEARATSIILPYLEERSNGRVVMTEKGRLGRFLQQTAGDFICQMKTGSDDSCWTIELKAEENYAQKTGNKNLFLETWSNKNLDNRDNHAMYGSNPGWLLKLQSDLLFYYFLAPDDLYIINFFQLKRWAFGANGQKAEIYKFQEVMQRKYGQHNDTWGRVVWVNELLKYSWCKKINVKQIPLFNDEAA